MHKNRKHHLLGVLALGICLLGPAAGGPLCNTANAQALDPDKEFEKARMKAAEIAEKAYPIALKINKYVGTAFSIAKGLLTSDPFAVFNALVELMGSDSGPPDITVRQARDEIITEIRKVREDELIARASSLSDRFGELLSAPENMTFDGRLENFLDDSSDLFNELDMIITTEDPLRAEMVYHLAPAYNLVTSSRAVGVATAGLPQSNIDNVLGAAYGANLALVSTNGSPHGGYLYDVVQKNAGYFYCYDQFTQEGSTAPWATWYLEMDLTEGWIPRIGGELADPFSTGLPQCGTQDAQIAIDARFDADPIVHLIRENAMNQMLALIAGQ
jgi:hypothetical protein